MHHAIGITSLLNVFVGIWYEELGLIGFVVQQALKGFKFSSGLTFLSF